MTTRKLDRCQFVDPSTGELCMKSARHFFIGPRYNERYCGEHKKHSWYMMSLGGVLYKIDDQWHKVTYEEYLVHEIMKS
jgi:hypothetical protein